MVCYLQNHSLPSPLLRINTQCLPSSPVSLRNTKTLRLYVLELMKRVNLFVLQHFYSGLRLGCTSSLRHGFDMLNLEAGYEPMQIYVTVTKSNILKLN